MKINENELKVLKHISNGYSADEWSAYYFKSIISGTRLELAQVRRACRSLAKKGLAKYERGLFDDDGQAAGSGYRATEEGAAIISPCDIVDCEKRAVYDYNVDEKGQQTIMPTGRRVQECEQHYEQSPRLSPTLF